MCLTLLVYYETLPVFHETKYMLERRDNWYIRLLAAITTAQGQLLHLRQPDQLFDGLLAALLELSDSEYGFIGETLDDDKGQPYLRTHAITNIAWNDYTRQYYEENAVDGLEFRNLKTLFGAVLTENEPVIANTPAHDPRRGGVPEGHPSLDAFLGIPLHSGGQMIGMAGVANRPEGYNHDLVENLGPFIHTCANAIFALQADTERRRAQADLSEEREKLRAILDSAYDGIITIDESGTIESCNRRSEEIFGRSQATMVGKNFSLLMPEPYRSDHNDYVKQYRESGQAKVMGLSREVIGCHSSGKQFPISLTINELQTGSRRLFTGLVRDLSEQEKNHRRLAELEGELERSRFGQLIGRSRAMQRMYKAIASVARLDWTVLIEGETGTGKELVARAIHAASPRRDGPFIAVNCAGLSDSLLASQLFGHTRGAFTGAVRDQPGFFQAAEGGTLFLDEIGDISSEVQTALLRALESSEIIPLGETVARTIDLRVIAATNLDLNQEVEKERFRQDLLYRLRVGRIEVPPLRERDEDITLLAEAFLAEVRVATGNAISTFSPSATKSLRGHPWPGNVRELRSAIQYAAMNCLSGLIDCSDLPPEIETLKVDPATLQAHNNEHADIQAALSQANGNRSMAAQLLGISRATLYRRLAELK